MLRYLVAARPLHERLRQVLTQIAGFALVVVSPRRSLPMLDGPVALATDALAPTRHELAALRVPLEARHHHFHLTAATDALLRCCALLKQRLRLDADEAASDALLRGLRRATEHLRAAARLLPGFEMVDLAQACCAAHAGPRRMVCS